MLNSNVGKAFIGEHRGLKNGKGKWEGDGEKGMGSKISNVGKAFIGEHRGLKNGPNAHTHTLVTLVIASFFLFLLFFLPPPPN